MQTMKIFGPPGTGKTFKLILTLKKLLERGYHPSQIAFLTHTKAAAEEARDRIAQEFDGYNLAKDFRWFRTIHSACCALLKVSRQEIMGTADLKTFSSESGWVVKGGVSMEMAVDQVEGERTHDIILNARSMASHTMRPLAEIIALLPDDPALASADRFLKDYDAYKERIGKIDFTDMLEIVEGKGALPVKVMLVDECQDLSDRQWKVIHAFAADCDFLYLAGDDDQAIYEFMGSSKNGFLDHECDQQHILDHSYRCARTIGEASKRIITRVARREEKDVTWRDAEGEVQRSGIEITGLPWRDWADGDKSVIVLFRHQKQAYRFGFTLQDMDLPYTIRGSSVTLSKEAQLIKIFLNMKHYGGSYSAAKIGAMMARAGDVKSAAAARSLSAPSLKLTMDDCKAVSNFAWGTDDWPRLFAKWDSERKKFGVLRRMINLYGIDIIGKKPAIDISTYHGSKGREADIVVLNTDCYKRTWDEQLTNPDVETRLCFVGLTRAKEKAIILSPRTDMYMRALVEN